MTFGSQVDPGEAQRIVDFSLANSLNFFDTANVYNKGESERILGACVRAHRGDVVIASKVRGPMDGGASGSGYEGLSRGAIFRAVDESLQRLGTDYIDIYYFHSPDYGVPIGESLDALERLVQAGKIRFPALSNYAAWQVTEARWIAAEKRYTPTAVTQPMYNLLARGIEQEYLPMAKHLGIFTCIYNPLAGGLLTGKQNKDRPLPGTRFDNNRNYLDRYWHSACFEAVDELSAAARIHGRSLISVALNWIYRNTEADCMIMGASRLEHLEENLAALDDGPLPEDLLRTCDLIWSNLRGVTPKYNR
jgi:aryl-alcohol dehydrogenase-like predicted oxidoreductase